MKIKYYLTSKTLWFNLIITLVEGAAFFEASGVLSQASLPWLMSIQGVGNVLLRVWFTDSALTFIKEEVGGV